MEQALALAEQRLAGGGALVAGKSRVVLTAGEAPYVVLETSMGKIVIELYWKHAPKTCQNFASLAARGYYDGVKFHRIIPGFMIQGGDPTGTGKGGESIYGGKFEDECHRELKHTGAGILSMANSGDNTNGSQFFITLAPTPWLDGRHTIFGRIASGMAMVKRLGSVVTDSTDRPVDEVRIIRGYASLLQSAGLGCPRDEDGDLLHHVFDTPGQGQELELSASNLHDGIPCPKTVCGAAMALA